MLSKNFVSSTNSATLEIGWYLSEKDLFEEVKKRILGFN